VNIPDTKRSGAKFCSTGIQKSWSQTLSNSGSISGSRTVTSQKHPLLNGTEPSWREMKMPKVRDSKTLLSNFLIHDSFFAGFAGI